MRPTGPDARPAVAPAGADLRLAGPAITAWVVTWFCLVQTVAFSAVLAGAAAAGLVPAVLLRRRSAAGAALMLIGLLAAAAGTGLRVWARDASPLTALAQRRAEVSVRLTVTDDPRLATRPVTYGSPPVVVSTQITELRSAGRTYQLGGRVLVLATDPAWQRLQPSQRLWASGRLGYPRGGDLTVAVLAARGPPVGVTGASTIQRAAGALRSGLRRACAGLPGRERGLLPGLVIGDTSGLDPALAEQFRTTGLTHLVAVSGTNCAIVCGAVLLLARRLRAPPAVAAGLAGLAMVGFVILARPSPSVLRAAVMGGLALLALAIGRPRAALPGLCAAVFALLLADPPLARSAGFALSVLATAGLLLLAPSWRGALRRRLPAGLAEAVAVPAAAQVACTPVIAAISGQIGLVAVPANLLAVPAVAPATLLGVLAALLSPVWPSAAAASARVAGLPTAWLVAVAQRGAQIPGATLPWAAGAAGGLLLAALLAAALLLGRVRAIRVGAACALCAAGVVALPMRVVAPGWPPAGWVMVVCDVGQGDALVLNAGPHTAVLVDTGPDPAAVDRCLRQLGILQIPLIVITHLHVDHVGGLSGALHGRRVGAIEVGPLDEPAPNWHHLEVQSTAVHLAPVEATVGERRVIGPLHLQVLAPRVAFHGTRSDPNNSSVVLRVVVAGRVLMLAGDAELDAQQALLSSGVDLRADVLKVAHHGSAYQLPGFLAAVRPSLALVSVGAGNPYGHPSEAILARLRLLGADVRRTDRDGELAVSIRAGRLFVTVTGPTLRRPVRPARPAAARGPPPAVRVRP
ncbi:MAG: ComEC/Rec2 family competence protein [Actinomycetota bacterium]|nr:ComEC/Rec2 family competence protein [Actinomycetota bacterium]